MSYTRPAYNAANATWAGASAYTRPANNAADATWQTTVYEALLADSGLPLAPAFVATGKQLAILADTGPLGAPTFSAIYGIGARIEVPGILGDVAFVALKGRVWQAAIDSPLGAVTALAFTDYTSVIPAGATIRYTMDLETPDGTVRVPISSWQATLQTENQSYVGCVVPACTEWLPDIEAATEFAINRSVTVDGAEISQEMARAPLQTLQVDQGPARKTASLSGYSDAFTEDSDPAAIYDRSLEGIRSVSSYASGSRVRCAIDWLLRPGQRALYQETSMVVSYVNFYVNATDSYMDVGERLT